MSGRDDVLIVGGGVVGLSVAYELLLRGRKVRILERGRVGRGATWASAGMLAPVSEADRAEADLVPFSMESLERFPDFVSGIEKRSGLPCGLKTGGLLHVAVDRDDEAELRHLEETLRLRDQPTRWLAASEVLEREPRVADRVLGGLLVEKDHQVDPRALATALCQAVRELGGEILEGFAVDAVSEEGGRVTGVQGRTAGGEPVRFECASVVLAAGAWTSEGIRSPASAIGVRPVKGQLVRLRGEELLRSVVWTPQVYLVPREGGELLVGGTVEEQGFDTLPTAGAVWDILREARALLPGLYDLEFVGVDVGLRPAVADNSPVIGPGGPEGLWIATGHYRQGILLAPATAHHLAEWLTTGEAPAALRPFGVERLRGGPSAARAEERA
jgi:glycine oxidase